MGEQLKWYEDKADNSAWIDALRQRATREGYCYQHVQASPSRSISTLRRRWATAITFSTSPMASANAAAISLQRKAQPARLT